MSISLKAGFKFTFIIGIILLFISLFMDWYSFRAIDSSGNIVIVWNYYLFFDWQTHLPDGTFINEIYRPKYTSVPLAIPIILIISLLIGIYGVLIYDIEKKEDFSVMKKYGYTNFIILLLNGFFIFIFPIYYLIPYTLYYPFMNFNNVELGMQFVYCMGTGYIMQVISFIFMFPYAVFYYHTIAIFEKRQYTFKAQMEKTLSKINETIDLDKFITEEKLVLEKMRATPKKKLVYDTQEEEEIESIYQKFLESKGSI